MAYAQNLVVNGGAESALIGGELPGWTEVSGTTWTRCGSPPCVPASEGSFHFFAGNPSTPCSSVGTNQFTSILSQVIDLSSYSTEIDAGIKAFYFSGQVRTWDDALNDESQIIVEYRNAANSVLSTYNSGATASTCCGNGSPAGWLQLTDTRFAPVGTRNIRIQLIATRLHSCDNDGYFDDIIFEPTCIAGTTTIDQTDICEYENATLSVTGQSGTIIWEYSYNAGGTWNSFGSNGTSQDVNPSLNPVFANSPVLFRPVLTEATCTNTSSNTVSLTINQPAVGGTVSAASNTICEGDNADLTLTGETGSIQWQQSNNGGAFSDVGTGTNSFNTTPTIGQSPLVFRNISTLGSCNDTSTTETITVLPNAVGGTTNLSNNPICDGETANVTLTGETGTIQWQQSINGAAYTNFGSGGSSETISPTFAQTPVSYRAVITSGTCMDTSTISTITINEAAQAGTVSAASTTLCEGDNADLTLVGETGIIQWQQSNNGGVFTDVGTGTNTYSTTPAIGQSPLVFRNISTLGSCTDTSNSETITVLPDAVGGTTNLTNNNICDGESSDLTLTGETGVIQWQQSINGAAYTNFGSGGNTETVSPTFAQTPVSYRAVITSGSCMDTSSISTITINDAAQGGTLSAGNTTICNLSSTTLTLTGQVGVIQWQRSLSGGAWTNFSTTSSSISVSPTIGDSPAQYRAVVTNAGICTDTSNTITVTVNQAIGGSLVISDNQICDGNSSTLSLSGESGTIQWQESLAGGGFSNFGGGANNEVVNPNISQSIAIYRVVTTVGTCTDTSNIISLTVDTAATPGTTSIIPDTLCEGSSTTLSNSGYDGIIQWQRSYNNSAWSDFGTGLSSETINPISTNSVARYRAIVTKGLCTDTSNIDSLNIIFVTGGTTSIDNPAICEGGNANVSVAGQVGTIQWQQSFSGGPFSNFGSGVNTENVSPTISESIAEYRVIASIGSCSDTSNITQLLVDSAANTGITDVSVDTLCEGSSTTLSNIGNNGSIQWQHSYNGGTWTNFGTGLSSETISPVSSNSVARYRAVISRGLCSEISNLDSVVIVNPIGGTTSLAASAICDGESTSINVTGESGAIQWERSYNGSPFTTFGTGTNSETISPTNADSPAQYRIVASIGSCTDVSTSSTLTINPNAVGGTTDIIADSMCNGTAESLTLTGSTGSIQWQQSLGGGIFTDFGTGSNPETISPTTADNTPKYRAITTLGACPDTSTIDSIFVIDVNSGTINASVTTICEGDPITLSASGQIGTLQWQQSLAGGAFTNFGTGTSSETVSPVFGDNPLQYRMTVNTGGCNDISAPINITVETVPGAPNSITGSLNTCNGDTETYTILTQPDATGYNWTSTAGSILSGNGSNTISLTTVAPSATIEVYPTNSCGTGLTSSTQNITTNTYPVAGIVNNDTAICFGDTYSMTSVESSGLPSGQLTYEWFDNGISLGSTNNTHLISGAGNYSVEITNNGLCSNASSQVVVNEVQVVVDAGPNQFINPGDAAILNGTSNGSYSYSWTPSSDLSNSTSLTPSANPVVTTDYILTATSSEGCIDTSSVTVEVLQFIDPANSFTPNGDGINDSWELPGIQGYPEHSVEIFNRWGSRVYYSINFTGWDGTYNGGKLPVATYYYIITLGTTDAPMTGSLTIVY